MNLIEKNEVHNFLETITAELTFGEARTAVRMEILSHLEDSIATAKSYGFSEADAITDAMKRIGNPHEIGKSLNKIHQPKFDILLPLICFSLCLIGIWNLSSTKWVNLQYTWIAIGISILVFTYFLSATKLKNFLSTLYIAGCLGLAASYFSGITAFGQPFLSFAGHTIKIVDLSAVLFSIGLPTLSSQLKIPKAPALSGIILFLLPFAYFSLNGFIWAGLLTLVSGLCFLGMQKISNITFLLIGVLGSCLLLSKFSTGLTPITEINKAIIENSHTDYALRSLSNIKGSEILATALLFAVLMYGFRLAFIVKEAMFRSIAMVCASLIAIQTTTSVLTNLGALPMISAGINVPFISYGGSGMIANFLIIGVLMSCFKRRTLSIVAF